MDVDALLPMGVDTLLPLEVDRLLRFVPLSKQTLPARRDLSLIQTSASWMSDLP